MQPLLWAIVLLYIVPGLFSDWHADSLLAQCYLDQAFDGHLLSAAI